MKAQAVIFPNLAEGTNPYFEVQEDCGLLDHHWKSFWGMALVSVLKLKAEEVCQKIGQGDCQGGSEGTCTRY